MENLGKITAFFVVIILAMLTSFLSAYVILDIGKLYKLEFIMSFSYLQILGIMTIIGMLKWKVEEKKDSSEFTKQLSKSMGLIVKAVLFTLTSWAISYLVFKVFS